MKDKKKKKEFLNGRKFFEGIKFWQKQIAGLAILKSNLKRSKAESKEFPQKIQHQVEVSTATERIIIKQLHQEIELRKKTEQVTQDALSYTENIIDTVREPLLVLDANLMVISASRSFYQVFKVKPEDTEKQYIYDLGNRQWDIPKLRELLEKILPKVTNFNNFEVEHNFLDIGKRIMLLNARKIYQETNHTQLILLAIEDITKRKELEEKLEILASHDELTGCLNFRSTMEFLTNEIARSRRYQRNFSIAMIDIDYFKRINDMYGHQAGNDALVAFVTVVKSSMRSIDVVGRYGGEEFIIIFPESNPQHALVVLERIRNNLEQTKIALSYLEKEKEFTLQFSAGIVAFPYNAGDLKELLWVADNALLQAKREGRNRAVLERRKLIRLSPRPKTIIEIVNSSGKDNVGTLQLADISKEGMLFLSTQDIPGEDLLCRIYRPKDATPFELTCKVKHKGKSKDELYRVGVYFQGIADSGKEKLSQYIGSLK